jgi:hypothetical protein
MFREVRLTVSSDGGLKCANEETREGDREETLT